MRKKETQRVTGPVPKDSLCLLMGILDKSHHSARCLQKKGGLHALEGPFQPLFHTDIPLGSPLLLLSIYQVTTSKEPWEVSSSSPIIVL